MNYESWRISFQSSEGAARSAYEEITTLRNQLAECQKDAASLDAYFKANIDKYMDTMYIDFDGNGNANFVIYKDGGAREHTADAKKFYILKDQAMNKETMFVDGIDYDADMDRFYIPVNSSYEIQTKGKGSSFRIANTKTHIRMLVADEHLHEMLEDMARGTNAELRQLQSDNESLRNQLANCSLARKDKP